MIPSFVGTNRELLREDSKEWVQLVSWQLDFVVVPPASWVCDLATAIAEVSDFGRLDDEQDYESLMTSKNSGTAKNATEVTKRRGTHYCKRPHWRMKLFNFNRSMLHSQDCE